MLSLLQDALLSAVMWTPITMAMGLGFAYFRTIDISIDGTAVVCAVATIWLHNATGSFFVTFVLVAILGAALGLLVPTLRFLFNVELIIGGVVVAIALHALTVMWVGESILLNDFSLTTTYGGLFSPALFSLFAALLLPLVFFCSMTGRHVISYMYRRAQPEINLPVTWVPFVSFSMLGLLTALGVFHLAMSQGLARGGGNFEYLVGALTGFLLSFRISVMVFEGGRQRSQSPFEKLDAPMSPFFVVFVCAAGAIMLQAITYVVVYYTPDPRVWKFSFAILLLMALVSLNGTRNSALNLLGTLSKIKRVEVDAKLRARALTKTIGRNGVKRTLFSDLSFEFDVGLHVIKGANGSGKTTLLRSIAGLTDFDAGELSLGDDRYGQKPSTKRDIKYLYQNPHSNFAATLEVWKNVSVMASLPVSSADCLDRKARYWLKERGLKAWDQVLDRTKLNQNPLSLSGGEAAYLSVLAGAMSPRKMLLVDEPTANLDAQNRDRIVDVLLGASESKIVIAVSHDPQLMEKAKQRVTL